MLTMVCPKLNMAFIDFACFNFESAPKLKHFMMHQHPYEPNYKYMITKVASVYLSVWCSAQLLLSLCNNPHCGIWWNVLLYPNVSNESTLTHCKSGINFKKLFKAYLFAGSIPATFYSCITSWPIHTLALFFHSGSFQRPQEFLFLHQVHRQPGWPVFSQRFEWPWHLHLEGGLSSGSAICCFTLSGSCVCSSSLNVIFPSRFLTPRILPWLCKVTAKK